MISARRIAAVILIAAVSALGWSVYSYRAKQQAYFSAYQPTKLKEAPVFLFGIGGPSVRLKEPFAVATGPGKLYFSGEGGVLNIAGLDGGVSRRIKTKRGEIRSIAADGSGRIYITSSLSSGIMVLNAKGGTIKENFGRKYLIKPMGLTYFDGRIYATDIGDHQVKIFSRQGKLVARFGDRGDAEGRFAYPHGLAVSGTGRIYVADSNNGRVQIFNRDRHYIGTLLRPPDTGKRIYLPRAVAIDKLGRVHVVDALGGAVCVYDSSGEYLFDYGKNHRNGGGLNYPNGIAVNKETGLVFIADRKNDRIAVWGED